VKIIPNTNPMIEHTIPAVAAPVGCPVAARLFCPIAPRTMPIRPVNIAIMLSTGHHMNIRDTIPKTNDAIAIKKPPQKRLFAKKHANERIIKTLC